MLDEVKLRDVLEDAASSVCVCGGGWKYLKKAKKQQITCLQLDGAIALYNINKVINAL